MSITLCGGVYILIVLVAALILYFLRNRMPMYDQKDDRWILPGDDDYKKD